MAEAEAKAKVMAEAEGASEHEMSAPTMVDEPIEPAPVIDAPVFQLGLNPEDDARAAAAMMYEHGHRRALSLVSGDAWGERLSQAFVVEFERIGGTVIDAGTYDAASSDHAAALRQLLGLNASTARHRALSRLLSADLGFEPNRRGDADALFLGARVRQARLIKPQLRFHHAVDLPVYATSHVFDGVGDPSLDRDLDGVFFADAPWLLNARGYQPTLGEATAAGLQSRGSAARLFALGMDSWRILPYLSWLGFSEESYPGATGDLSVRRDGEIRRMPTPAQFQRGTPRVVERAEPSSP
jgi:outer membrane PBP1 activator LpoA protein